MITLSTSFSPFWPSLKPWQTSRDHAGHTQALCPLKRTASLANTWFTHHPKIGRFRHGLLTDAIIDLLRRLAVRADARRMVSLIPLGSIYWEDEMPDYLDLAKLSEDERNAVWRLFAIRFKVWDANRSRLTIRSSGTPPMPRCRPGHYFTASF